MNHPIPELIKFPTLMGSDKLGGRVFAADSTSVVAVQSLSSTSWREFSPSETLRLRTSNNEAASYKPHRTQEKSLMTSDAAPRRNCAPRIGMEGKCPDNRNSLRSVPILA